MASKLTASGNFTIRKGKNHVMSVRAGGSFVHDRAFRDYVLGMANLAIDLRDALENQAADVALAHDGQVEQWQEYLTDKADEVLERYDAIIKKGERL